MVPESCKYFSLLYARQFYKWSFLVASIFVFDMLFLCDVSRVTC